MRVFSSVNGRVLPCGWVRLECVCVWFECVRESSPCGYEWFGVLGMDPSAFVDIHLLIRFMSKLPLVLE